jgi:dUTP pyrophosphatase
MRINAIHPGFIMPSKGSIGAGAFDLYMPESGTAIGKSLLFGLGFAAEVPIGHVALLLPRSSTGAKYGVELHNTCGVIDSDYRGEWKAALKTKTRLPYSWEAGERVLQFMIVPVVTPELELVDSLEDTARGKGGFGSSGN